jgi:ATP-dependent DNA ligase
VTPVFAQNAVHQQNVLRVKLDGFRNDKGKAHCILFNDADPSAFPEHDEKAYKRGVVPELVRAVKKHQLEGIIAKRAGSQYRSGERCADWVKWRANRGQEFVIDGYIANGNVLDSLLVGYYEGRDLMYAASVRAGIPPEFRRVLVPHLEGLPISRCPFANLPDRGEGRWGEGLTASKMAACCWIHPFIVARVEFLELDARKSVTSSALCRAPE